MTNNEKPQRYCIKESDKISFDSGKYIVLRYDKKAEYGELNRGVLLEWCLEASSYEELEEVAKDLYEDLKLEESE